MGVTDDVRSPRRLESDRQLIRELGLVRERGILRVDSPNPDLRTLELPVLRELVQRWDVTGRSFANKLINLVQVAIGELPVGLARAAAARLYGLDCDPTFPRPAQWRTEARKMYPLLGADEWRKGVELEILGLIAGNIRALTAGVPAPRQADLDQSLSLDGWKVTSTLPRSVRIVGREFELRRIAGTLGTAGGAEQAMAICALHGMAGAGKTALAVAAAHGLESAFPDGRLYLDLHGFTAGRDPLSALDALGRLLRQIAVPISMIPVDLDERASLWRDRLSRRKVLVVLDNVVSSKQVELLLPGAPTCAVLLTSRRYLSGLNQATQIFVSHLDERSAVTLMRTLLEAHRSDCGSSVLERIAKACRYLPLALHIVAGYAQRRPGMHLVELAALLESSTTRLTRIVDRDGAISKALLASYKQIGASGQNVLRASAMLPGITVTPGKIAAACSLTTESAENVLDHLFENHLIENLAPGVYQLHDIIRDYLRNLVAQEPGSHDTDKSLLDVARYYRGRLHEFMPCLYGVGVSLRAMPPASNSPEMAALARAWLECERDSIIATIKALADRGLGVQAAELADLLSRDLLVKGYFRQAIAIHSQVLDTADRPALRVAARENLGAVYLETGDFPGALECFLRTKEEYLRSGDRYGAARVLGRIGFTFERTGDYSAAEQALTQSMRYLDDEEDRVALGTAFNSLGAVRWRQENYAGALACFWRALSIRRSMGDLFGEARTLNNIGFTFERLGEHRRAVAFLRHSWRMTVAQGDMNTLAIVMNNFGYTLCDMTQFEAGLWFSRQGLETARTIGSTYEEARALDALGLNFSGMREHVLAMASWRLSLRIFSRLKVPEAAVLNDRIANA
jgi:tetratricopeptide (TPR) repeat protein